VKRILGFATVGSIGFLIDAGVLLALTEYAAVNPFAARFVSFPVATIGTWALNRSFVFSTSATTLGQRAREYGRYFGIQTLGAATNMLVYFVALLAFPPLMRWPVVALALGAAVGLLVNYSGSKRWVFKQQ
jgi:putative flippase GtrA